MLTSVLQVALGGAIGASARYLTTNAAMRLLGAGFPWGTLVVNVLGSFLMGVVVAGLAARDGTRLAPLLVTGVLGGFTTFSAFSLDAVGLWERGQEVMAGLYVAGSVAVSIGALVAGLVLARSVLA